MILENVSSVIKDRFYKRNENNNSFNKKFLDYFYSRKDYASRIINSLHSMSNSFSLFQIRRKGKTTFLLDDLADVASDRFYVFYYSFMRGNNLEDYDLYQHFKKSLFDFLKTTICNQSIKVPKEKNIFIKKIGLLSFNLEFDKEYNEKEIFEKMDLSDIFLLMGEYSDKPILFLLDEFQEIAKFKNSIDFLKTLRTELDIRKTYISCVFTGSSYNELDVLFNQYNHPFFRFTNKMDFPDLDNDFIYFCTDVFMNRIKETNSFNELMKNFRKITLEDNNETNFNEDDLKKWLNNNLIKIFNETGKFPVIIKDILQKLEITLNLENLNEYAIDHNLNRENEDNRKIWINLSQIERNILFRIVKNKNKIGSTLSEDGFLKGVEKSKIDYAIRKLKQKNLILKEGKQSWLITDQSFKRYIDDYVHEKDL